VSGLRSNLWRALWTVLLPAVALVMNSCDESLPPRTTPAVLFRPSISPQTAVTEGYNQLYIYFSVTNIFDETLQGPASVTGNLVITLERDPSIHKTVAVDKSLLLGTHPVPDGEVTLDPGDSLAFLFKWEDFIDDNGNSLYTTVFHTMQDPHNPSQVVPAPETFIVQGGIQVFTTSGFVTLTPVRHVFYYYNASD